MMAIDRSGRLYAALSAGRRNVIRRAKRLRHVHPTAYLHPSARVYRDLVAGEWVFVGPRANLDPMVEIGRYTMLAAGVAIVGDDHVVDRVGVPMQFTGRPPQSRTLIGRDVWVGREAMIRRGVRIGDGAIVGARSVVTGDVSPYHVVVGVPARQVGTRFEDADRRRHNDMLYGPTVARVVAAPLTGD